MPAPLLAGLLLELILLAAGADVVVERVEAIRGVATLDNAGGEFEDATGAEVLIEDAWVEGLLVATLGLGFGFAEYQLFMTELI